MTSVNERFRQVVNLAGQVSELNTAELECGTLKTSSLLANSVRPRLSNGVVKSVDYSVTTAASGTPGAVTLTGEEPSSDDVILSASMKSTGTIPNGTIALKVDGVDVITLSGTSVDTTVVNRGGVLGQEVSNISGGAITVTHPVPTTEATVSGTVTYFEPNE